MYDSREDGKAVIEKDKNGPELRVGRDAFRFCLLWFVACVDYQLVWEVNEKPTEFGKHIVVRRNNIQEVLYDANVEIGPLRICWNCYLWSVDASWHHRKNKFRLMPHSGMMTACVPHKSECRKP